MSACPDLSEEIRSPQWVDLWLRRYREICLLTSGGNVRAIGYTEKCFGEPVDPQRLSDIKADLERALLQLRQLDEDPVAAMWIHDCYILGKRTDEIADADGAAQRTIQWRMARGRRRMAWILGWRGE